MIESYYSVFYNYLWKFLELPGEGLFSKILKTSEGQVSCPFLFFVIPAISGGTHDA